MIEDMENSMASIKVMENDGFEHNNLRWFCPTQKHLEKKLSRQIMESFHFNTITTSYIYITHFATYTKGKNQVTQLILNVV
jgi:hypothetical protein